jgi:hypothetical protein
MNITKNSILPILTTTIALSTSCCTTIKTQHHITLNHNIKVEIEAKTISNVFDRWEALTQTQSKYVELCVDQFVDELYEDIE